MAQIEKIEKDISDLKIKWSDGEESKFNYMWLRDNCPTAHDKDCLLYTSPSPRDYPGSRMPSSA